MSESQRRPGAQSSRTRLQLFCEHLVRLVRSVSAATVNSLVNARATTRTQSHVEAAPATRRRNLCVPGFSGGNSRVVIVRAASTSAHTLKHKHRSTKSSGLSLSYSTHTHTHVYPGSYELTKQHQKHAVIPVLRGRWMQNRREGGREGVKACVVLERSAMFKIP